MIQGYDQAPGFLTDPSGSSPLLAATSWIQGTLLGTIATVVAILCIASVGLLMLTGRIDVRRGLTVVLGCFVLFGSASIVQGLRGAADSQPTALAEPVRLPQQIDVPLPTAPATPYDPYAGASVIRR